MLRADVLILLGATACQAVFGPAFRLTRERGKPLTADLAPVVVATAHPSSILRAPDDAAARRRLSRLVADLRVAAGELRKRRRR